MSFQEPPLRDPRWSSGKRRPRCHCGHLKIEHRYGPWPSPSPCRACDCENYRLFSMSGPRIEEERAWWDEQAKHDPVPLDPNERLREAFAAGYRAGTPDTESEDIIEGAWLGWLDTQDSAGLSEEVVAEPEEPRP
jgi:hypothetical protein